MRIAAIATLSLLLAFAGVQIWQFRERRVLDEARLADIQTQFERATVEHEQLKGDVKYFERPENLEKELRARFNYRKADERLIIVVPNASSSPSPVQ